jgi:type IV secretory pathway TrbD component
MQVWIIFGVALFTFVMALSLVTKRRNEQVRELNTRPKSYAEHLSDNVIYVLTIISGNGE